MQICNKLPQIRKPKIYYGIFAIILVLFSISVMVWNSHRKIKEDAENVMVVQTSLIGAEASSQEYTYPGEVRGRYESEMAFQVNGKIIRRNAEVGKLVHVGDVLMQIDPKDIAQTVKSASAQVNSVESQLHLAESNLNRFRELYESGAVSRMTYDQYVNSYEVAVAAVQQAEAQQAQGTNQLDYTALRADHAGVIAAIKAEAGQIVNAGQTVLTIVQDGEREVEINVPENRIEDLRKAQKIKVTFWALPKVSADGQVREIAPMADPVTRTYKVRVSLINPPAEMTMGMTAAVSLVDSENQRIIRVPLSAIYQNGDTPSVWVIIADTVTLRPVKTGEFADGSIQIISGLQEGDRIVTAGVHKLYQGQRVKWDGDAL